MCVCKSRRVPAIIVGISAVITFLLGVAMVILSLEFQFSFEDMSNLKKYKDMIFIFLIVASMLAVVSAILPSIIACKHRHWCFNVNSGIFMFISWIILLAMGVIIMVVSFTSEETFMSFCSTETAPKTGFKGFMKNLIDDTDKTIGNQISNFMCSNVCPCAPPNAKTLAEWTGMTSAELAAYRRAPPLENSSTDPNGYQRLFFTTDSKYKVYDSFLACQKDIIDGNRKVQDSQWKTFGEVAGATSLAPAT